ncbi:MAG: AraC-like DNA-binding protein, partial [Gammaproteobacteria bacterium]
KVGYTSPSQFSREFKRHFNKTPSEVLTQLHS